MRDLQLYAQKALQMCRAHGVPYGSIAEFRVNTRAKSRWGVCKRLAGGAYRIEINAVLLDEKSSSKEGLLNTLLHEIIHTCPDCMNHKYKWKAYAAVMNDAYGLNIKRTDSCEDKGVDQAAYERQKRARARLAPMYLVYCSNYSCRVRILRKKASKVVKYPERYRCPKCGSRILVRMLKKEETDEYLHSLRA